MKKIILSLAVIAVVGVGAIGATRAYFSDTASSTENTFTAGTLELTHAGLIDASAITIPNMAPGEVSNEYSVIIKNNADINLAWLGDWQFGGNEEMKNAIYIASAKMEFLSPNGVNWLDDSTTGYTLASDVLGTAIGGTAAADVFIKNGTGSGPYGSAYTAQATLTPFSTFMTLNKFNNFGGMVPGSNYELAGALKHNYSYKLTVRFGMVPGADNGYQGLGPVTAKLVVNATQINALALEAQGVPVGAGTGLVTWMNTLIANQLEN